MVDFDKLRAPFPKDSVSWRAQHISKKDNGNSQALALAYIDARDVMNRLDDVCGPGGWQCKYSHANGKTVCDIGILVDNQKTGIIEWIWKADGAGDSDIEAEKGALSDAFKRAAVRWGIGRYLYDLEAVWVPCNINSNGKWQSWIGDPWKHVKPEKRAGFETARQQNSRWIEIKDELISCAADEESTKQDLAAIWQKYQPELTVFKRSDPEIYKQLEITKDNCKLDIEQREMMKAGMPQGFNKVRSNA
jgi:hypothetical protein